MGWVFVSWPPTQTLDRERPPDGPAVKVRTRFVISFAYVLLVVIVALTVPLGIAFVTALDQKWKRSH